MDSDDDDDDTKLDYNLNPSKAFQTGASSKSEKSESKTKPAPGKIYTLRDAADESDEEDDENKGQAFYAGGSETSGQQILGPSKKNNPEHIIKDLFKKAKE